MSEKLTAKEYAEKLLYTPEYAADKLAACVTVLSPYHRD